jgi:hypothetical protein
MKRFLFVALILLSACTAPVINPEWLVNAESAIDQGNILLCEENSDCISHVAKELREPQFCERINNLEHRGSHCITPLAVELKDETLCERAPSTRYASAKEVIERCISNVAEAKADASLCESLTLQYYKNACYSGVAPTLKDISLCDSIDVAADATGLQTYVCIAGVAEATKNPDLCDRIYSYHWQRQCRHDSRGSFFR